MGYSGINNKVIKKQRSVATKYSSKLKSVATNLGVPFSFKIKQGSNPVKEIINFATSYKCDLIVLGSHGRTGWSKLILGSVANGVVQHAKSSVLVVK
jgi:nucleotide-binding universal stress UspA family protein